MVAYQVLVPSDVENQELLLTTGGTVEALPVPEQTQSTGSSVPSSNQPNQPTSQAQESVTFRRGTESLVAGQKPKPTAVVTDTQGNKKYLWCSGVNPQLPDEVCQAVITITSYPTESNPHLGEKAKQSLSLLPRDTSRTMDEMSWEPIGADDGTMIVMARTAEYGEVPIKLLFELRNGIWVLADGQVAQ